MKAAPSGALVLVLVVPLLVGPAATAGAAAQFAEDWEYAVGGDWTLAAGEGIGHDCQRALGTGCHVKADPPCCPGSHTRYAKPVDVAMDGRIDLTFSFWASDLGGGHDAVLQLALDDGWVNFELTGGSGNNLVEVFTVDGTRRAAAAWSEGGTWHRVRGVLDPASGGAWVELWTNDGVLVGTSPPAPLPAGATRVVEISIQAARWTADDVVHRFDNVVLQKAGVALVHETWDPLIVGWTPRGTPTIDCELGRPGCSLLLAPSPGGVAAVERAIVVPPARFTTVEFWYRWDGSGASADAVVQVRLDGGGTFNVELTGGSGNNLAELFVPNLPKVPIGVIPSGQWVRVVAEIDTFLHLVSAEIYRENGARLGASLPLPLPLGARQVTGLLFHANDWGASALEFRFDSVRVAAGA